MDSLRLPAESVSFSIGRQREVRTCLWTCWPHPIPSMQSKSAPQPARMDFLSGTIFSHQYCTFKQTTVGEKTKTDMCFHFYNRWLQKGFSMRDSNISPGLYMMDIPTKSS
ncbi:hypothetical protein DPMN_118289 [Dreissena polymorpha]|uniref:Uncharacterized protein n=1 Tax=Dreissena polymorpha TaxID=45954 RepID=A0A9D4GKH1_DREPO|nr:hypothetical protein DPMN_118289 [Dreissena polymorpha]